MQQTIKPLGIATNPSDYDCPDGELAASFNIINEDGALRPLPQPVATNITLDSGDEIRCIHATSTFKHYIATNGSTLAWYNPNAAGTEEDPIRKAIPLPATIHKVTPIGNTLAVLTDSGLCYLLWKYDDNNNATYTNLGPKPPFLELQFGTSQPYNEDSEGNATRLTDIPFSTFLEEDDGENSPISEVYRNTITNEVWAMVNSRNATTTENGHFYAPFFVRYCYHMMDGSLVMHSAPVFMPLCMPRTLDVFLDLNASAQSSHVCLEYRQREIALTYSVLNPSVLSQLRSDWRDIVKSVDIFVSLPIIREDTEKTIKKIAPRPAYVCYEGNMLYTFSHDGFRSTMPDIPLRYTDREFLDYIKSVSDFYKIASYDITDEETGLDTTSGFHEVYIRSGVLSTLATQEAMTDDYHSHNDVLPTIEDNRCITSLFNYNNRLSIAAPTERLFKGFSLETMLPKATNTPTTPNIRAIVVHIRTEQGIKQVVYDYSADNLQSVSTLMLESTPLFYPDNRAFAFDVYVMTPQLKAFRLPMKQHPLLNGATTGGSLITSIQPHGFGLRDVGNLPVANDTLTTLNQIRTSEVDNPFYYPAINYKRVGVGTILALSTSAKALSQGQFGQHPLYAFCTDGVWALGVDTTDGTFVPAQPFTRDVCSNPDSILQLDSTVLFPTDRGIMLVSGSQTQCITEKLDYPHFNISNLPQCSQFLPQGAMDLPNPMRDYIRNCKMIYDYRNQRVVVFNTAHPYAYVYSLKSGLWAMMQSDFVATLNAYPNAMAVNSSGKLVNFLDLSDPSNPSNPSNPPSQFSILNSQFYVTRPFKLGSNEHKTITALVQHGMIEDRQHVKLILYGSRDLVQWHVVGSSTTNTLRGLSGTPYTAFRLAVIADLTATESLSDFSVQFTPKHKRVLR